MAEISYPFAAASAGGGSELVSQVEWQNMSHLWSPDRIDFQLTEPTYTNSSLPFWAEFSGADLVIHPGSAWVGGFYYKLDAPLTLTAPTNGGAQPRTDLIVLRADMATGSVNVAIKQGQAAATPVEPTVQRTLGGVWEMPLWAFELEANNGARGPRDRRRFDVPGVTAAPWYAAEVSQGSPAGNFVLDMDANNTGGQTEGFRGRDGFAVTRHLGKRREYTPDLFPVSNKPATANRKGYWRYIAPGTVQFTIHIQNTSTRAVADTRTSPIIGFTLPRAATVIAPCVFHGFVRNPGNRDGLPNFIDIVATNGGGGNSNCYLYYPNDSNPSLGLDALKLIPGKSDLTLTGIYETNDFD